MICLGKKGQVAKSALKKITIGNMEYIGLKLSGCLLEQNDNQLIGCKDADLASDISDRKSNTKFLPKYFGAAENSLLTLSSTKAEYVALSEKAKERFWIK